MSDASVPALTRWTRDYVFDILRDLGIRHIFGVPGTNEIPIIDGCSVPENDVTYIECLHENIAIGAAMGNARMTGKPGVFVCHVTPGIGHAIGNLFNAQRSKAPLVILCCQQHNDLVTQEPLLASNLVKVAEQYTKWAHEVRTPDEMGMVLQRAFKEAMAPPCGPVFVSIPWDFTIVAIPDHTRVKGVTRIPPRFVGDPEGVRAAAEVLSKAKNPIILAGDAVGYAEAWLELRETAELLGAPVLLESFSSLQNFPNDDPHWQGELPGAQAAIQNVLKAHDVAFLCGFGAQAQLAVFKYADGPLLPDSLTQVVLTNSAWDIGKNYFADAAILGDVKATLPGLNDLLRRNRPEGAEARNEAMRQGAVTRAKAWDAYHEQAMAHPDIWAVVIARALRDLILERGLEKAFVYAHEAVSDPAPFQFYLPFNEAAARPISYYCTQAGSLGWSMPATLGIKLAERGHQGLETKLVVNAVGDGSSLFYPQVWWTAAHRKLPILTIVTNNREYHTLQLGLSQVVAAYGNAPGFGWNPVTLEPEYLRIERPDLDFVALARAFGVTDGATVVGPAAVRDALSKALDVVLDEGRPYVLDMRICQTTAAPPSTGDDAETVADPLKYADQPPLDVAHPTEPLQANALLPIGGTTAAIPF